VMYSNIQPNKDLVKQIEKNVNYFKKNRHYSNKTEFLRDNNKMTKEYSLVYGCRFQSNGGKIPNFALETASITDRRLQFVNCDIT